MKPQNNFNVTQEYEIIPHQKGKAYTISVKEWMFLKSKIKEIDIDINNFYWIGFLLLGAGASALLTILVTDFKDDVSSKYLTWCFMFIMVTVGLLSLFFAYKTHKSEKAKPQEILNQMELIESKFEQN